ncbi:MAG: helix-turn-helix domain-containing protein [Leptolyngbyaceae cyanobacterium SM1_1_3]|nr:helix-turn-helix domain-containing protein [Leptolyngbyaceae cyanobacterium SM1_1_3]NJN04656.1 helix-turn-helix domain-containing protein [Leptolyngbyaceae cyanobacterium RM1_1_2]NJO10505.1 helix-turn-helix domain-containing protein [Leptolyngbyaceae cyanobacterium SL_1_1]
MASDRTLLQLMQQAEISSFRRLSQRAGVSEWQVRQLRQGKITQMRLQVLMQLAKALRVSLPQLLTAFAPMVLAQAATVLEPAPATETALAQEYQRLQAQLAEQKEQLQQKFQQDSLNTLESWLLNWPTAVYAAQHNPQIPAGRLVPLVRPIENLLADWGIEAIAPIGAELAYDPQQHQLIAGSAQPGEAVRVRYAGYRQGEKLLYRAKVSLL